WLFVLECCEDPSAGRGGPSEDSRLALEHAERNQKAAPRNPYFLRDLGALEYHLGRLAEAEPLLREAWRQNHRMVSAAFHLAMVQHRRGETGEARDLFQEAAKAIDDSSADPDPRIQELVRLRSFAQSVLGK